MMKLTLLTIALTSILVQMVFAGADAKVEVCLKWEGAVPTNRVPMLEIFPGQPSYVCMNQVGSYATKRIDRRGFNCASVGIVELKSSSSGGDTCASDNSFWWVTIRIEGYVFAAYVKWYDRHWYDPNPRVQIERQPHQGNMIVCGRDKDEQQCDSKGSIGQGWPGNQQGDIYFVFRVGAGASSESLNSTSIDGHEAQNVLEQEPASELK